RPDVMAVIHAHSPEMIVFGASGVPLRNMIHTGSFINDGVPVLIRRRDRAVDVLLPGNRLGLAVSCWPALERLQAGPVRFADFAPELAPADRERLAQTLVRAGVAQIDDARD
ncbi:MAG: hypothetical protein ABSH03_10640, partial [Candidatus Lustribacter sp.]